MKKQENELTDDEMRDIASKTETYSNSDLKELCKEAAYGPIRDIETIQLATIEKLRPVNHNDLLNALKKVRGILNDQLLNELIEWDKNYGATI
jgi:SpoVK/Ycf46/Vps4 family AAA+-type ATPase